MEVQYSLALNHMVQTFVFMEVVTSAVHLTSGKSCPREHVCVLSRP